MSVGDFIFQLVLLVIAFVVAASLWLGFCYWLGGGLGVLIGIGIWVLNTPCERST